MGFRGFGIELNGFAARRLGLAQVVLRGIPIHVEERGAIGDAGVSARVAGIHHDGAGEHLAGELKSFAAKLVEELPPAQIIIVSLDVGRGRLLDGALFGFRQHHLEGFGDALRDFILDGEHILKLAVVALRPHGAGGAGFDQARRDAQALARAPKAALEDVSGVQFAPHVRRAHRLVAISEHRRARQHPQVLNLRELGDDIFRDAVAEVFVIFRTGGILKIQHGQRLFGGRRHRGRGAPGARIALQALEVGAQARRALIASPGIFLERFGYDLLEFRGQARVPLAKRRGGPIEDGVEDHGGGAPRKRRLS